jgi:endonuclease/exonuclease/phosphatase family metal-dependent hydrolase
VTHVLRVMTYNIRHGLGGDGRIDLGRIADVIAAFDPDVLGLQEVDVGRLRSGVVDQAAELARRLGMEPQFAPCIERGGERYGIATLTRVPIAATRQIMLPRGPRTRRFEQRCALVTRLAWPAERGTLDVVNTHLSTVFRERPAQVAAIVRDAAGEAGSTATGHGGRRERTSGIVLGDFNCTPWSPAYRALCVPGLRSATRLALSWHAKLPLWPIDHIFYRGPLEVIRSGTWSAAGARDASDHLPVIAELAHRGDA